MIRGAVLDDIEDLVDLGEAMHAVSTYSHISYSRTKVAALIKRLIEGEGVVFVYEKDGDVIGCLGGGVTEYWFSEELTGFDYSFVIDPAKANGIAALRLIAAFKLWCKAKGARQMKMGITTGINVEKMAKLYQVAGFVPDGLLFKMEL